ncbi:hypothetical protein DRE_07349 [Drechslerella stenobrocha 248]|uniref:Thioesterase domain-containing protein n=1 Tax=Drechslerella stenobrocha 248 TaxID=1043628 RepID=W7HL63_9PEZI|nr:hypothetical protein DRE_07349 [Drechslerella stenobrocha 248]
MNQVPTFLEASAVTQLTSHSYSANLSSAYCIGSVPNGGYVSAVVLRAAAAHMTITHSHVSPLQRHAISYHAMFMIKTNAGPVELKVSDTKIGRSYSVLHIELLQDNLNCVNAYVTMGNIENETGPSLETHWDIPRPSLTGTENLDRLLTPKGVPGWVERPRPFADFREVSKRVRFFTPTNDTPGVVTNWATFQNPDELITDAAIALIADLFLGVVEQLDPDSWTDTGKTKLPTSKYWYPTLSLSLDVKKALPKEGAKWVYSKVQSHQIKNGRWDLQVVLLDQNGELLATSSQVALMVDAARNTKPRGKREQVHTKL